MPTAFARDNDQFRPIMLDWRLTEKHVCLLPLSRRRKSNDQEHQCLQSIHRRLVDVYFRPRLGGVGFGKPDG